MRYVDKVEPRPCYVADGEELWPGSVLSWRRDGETWRALVRYLRPMPEGYRLAYEHWLPGEVLTPRG
jgi:hypothetical protein